MAKVEGVPPISGIGVAQGSWARLMEEAFGRLESAEQELKSAKLELRQLQKDRRRYQQTT